MLFQWMNHDISWMNVAWVESSGRGQLGTIAFPLPMLCHDHRQAAGHLQDESEHTMGQGTLSSEAVELQISSG